jgi:predicted  nucleic acid-binding Zn-ribbon protein
MPPPDHPLRRLQALDLRAGALRAERAELPERGALRDHRDALAAVEGRVGEAAGELEVLRGRERELEVEVARAAERAKSVEDDLYSGRIAVPRELETLQSELQSCRARQAELEERELECMECMEARAREIASLESRRADLDANAASLRQALAAAEQRIDGELEALRAARDATCGEIARGGGGVAPRLDGDACGRCRMALPIVERTRLRTEGGDAFATCASCQRMILL